MLALIEIYPMKPSELQNSVKSYDKKLPQYDSTEDFRGVSGCPQLS